MTNSSIVSQSPQQGKFETVHSLVTALQFYHGQQFETWWQHIGGHGSVLIAQSQGNPSITEMIVTRNGRGWHLGCWGAGFGHADITRTNILYETDDSRANAMAEYHIRLMEEAGLSDDAAAAATRRHFRQEMV